MRCIAFKFHRATRAAAPRSTATRLGAVYLIYETRILISKAIACAAAAKHDDDDGDDDSDDDDDNDDNNDDEHDDDDEGNGRSEGKGGSTPAGPNSSK